MSMHKLSAGSGYDYLTRQVAALDSTEKGHTGLVATIPGGLFEIFFGIWLIAKGFNPSAITIGGANTL